ncbi:MAG TPA: endopeptidase, partial [Stenotrophomonas sp.]|nr:endopeptidase [Stenotrophomonas sp.]
MLTRLLALGVVIGVAGWWLLASGNDVPEKAAAAQVVAAPVAAAPVAESRQTGTGAPGADLVAPAEGTQAGPGGAAAPSRMLLPVQGI